MLVVRLFVSYARVGLCRFFSSSWCRGLAATSACGSSWAFLLTFSKLDILLLEIITNSGMNGTPKSSKRRNLHSVV